MTPGGGICETRALQAAVIPAKAGIHFANLRKYAVQGLDSRFRGNDRRLVSDDIPNDTTTMTRRLGVSRCRIWEWRCTRSS
jgi:hypothetical protein